MNRTRIRYHLKSSQFSALWRCSGRHGLAICHWWRALCLLQISRSRFSIIIGPDLLRLYRCGDGWKLPILASYNRCQRQLPGINMVSGAALRCRGGTAPLIYNFGYKFISNADLFPLCSVGRLTKENKSLPMLKRKKFYFTWKVIWEVFMQTWW